MRNWWAGWDRPAAGRKKLEFWRTAGAPKGKTKENMKGMGVPQARPKGKMKKNCAPQARPKGKIRENWNMVRAAGARKRAERA